MPKFFRAKPRKWYLKKKKLNGKKKTVYAHVGRTMKKW